VVHLDHELRGEASAGDAEFVRELARRLGLPFTVARRSEIEPTIPELPANDSARYRAIRLELFRRVVEKNKLAGVILAHHADDVAETVMQRLIRGSGPSGLTGISPDSMVGGLRIIRPMLDVRRSQLREMLAKRNQNWREDASNAGDDYLRNRLRKVLEDRPELTASLLDLAAACRTLHEWAEKTSPKLSATFAARELESIHPILAQAAARRWLIEAGAPPEELSSSVLNRLVEMATDAATPARRQFPGGIAVRRRAGKVSRV
jgi:tRNA(Ile)-lysidine synthase